MSDYLTRLIERSLRPSGAIALRHHSPFEPARPRSPVPWAETEEPWLSGVDEALPAEPGTGEAGDAPAERTGRSPTAARATRPAPALEGPDHSEHAYGPALRRLHGTDPARRDERAASGKIRTGSAGTPAVPDAVTTGHTPRSPVADANPDGRRRQGRRPEMPLAVTLSQGPGRLAEPLVMAASVPGDAGADSPGRVPALPSRTHPGERPAIGAPDAPGAVGPLEAPVRMGAAHKRDGDRIGMRSEEDEAASPTPEDSTRPRLDVPRSGDTEPAWPRPRPPVLPRLTVRSRFTRAEPAPTVHVSIGRVEVRATAPPPAPGRPPATTPAMSLDDYLGERARGSRR